MEPAYKYKHTAWHRCCNEGKAQQSVPGVDWAAVAVAVLVLGAMESADRPAAVAATESDAGA